MGAPASAAVHALRLNITCIPAMLQVRLLLLAALAGEHVLYVGPPGTAKSELGRRLTRLCKGTFFERLLTRFSVPEVSQAQRGSQPHNGLDSAGCQAALLPAAL